MDLKLVILRKLYRHRIIGGKHTAVENLTKRLPKHLVGEAKSAVEDLIKQGLKSQSRLLMACRLALTLKDSDHFKNG